MKMCPLALVAAAAEGAGEATGGTPWGGTKAVTAQLLPFHYVSLTVEWRKQWLRGEPHCRLLRGVVEWRGENRSDGCDVT
jgi:hypothetical protein